jgi:hypothetical protein
VTDTQSTLLPCPFCGGEGQISKHHKQEVWSFLHRCPVMGLMTMDWLTSVDAIAKKWNTRSARRHQVYHDELAPLLAAQKPNGCICPVGAEATCGGIACPRRGYAGVKAT